MNTRMLNERIKLFYDQSTPLWLHLWGEHMHQGYYGIKAGQANKTYAKAQEDLVEELLLWSNIRQANHILDAGCGIGASARTLAKKFDAKVLGITISPVQAEKGRQYTRTAGPEHSVTIEALDMANLDRDEQKFDLVWSVESFEYVADKKELLSLFYDLLMPGGHLLIAGWYHRFEPPVLEKAEQLILNKVYQQLHFRSLVSLQALESFAKQAGFTDVRSADWSEAIVPFWKVGISTFFRWKFLTGLFKAGWPNLKNSWALRYMIKGFRKKLIRYGVFYGTKKINSS
ncbi:MAG: class I SAM-dependent methyltransferase [Saprospiraceae bacterium]|nr:class I SAM-dependent methyltransferase [Saprospiraceae bacterium]MCB9324047.1 class I SAM-dependent methyltransferase [Lewinellaceae bacterium]